MKNLKISILMTIVTTILLGVVYPFVVTGLAHLIFPKQANGELITQNGKIVGSRLIGQPVSSQGYFRSRPSAAGNGYDAGNSGGSNLGPTNKMLIDRVSADVQKLQAENPNMPVPIGKSQCARSDGFGYDVRLGPRSAHFTGSRSVSDPSSGPGTRHGGKRCPRSRRETHRGPPAWLSRRAPRKCVGAESGPRYRPPTALDFISSSPSRAAVRQAQTDSPPTDRCGCTWDGRGPARSSSATG